MDIDYLTNLSVDLFIQHITYLPFTDVISICSANKKLHGYCMNYNNHWKRLIDNTFSIVYDYQNKLREIQTKLGSDDSPEGESKRSLEKQTYNYLVYTQLINILDPVTQAMIYYKQKDWKSFDMYEKEV